ncbi:MAG: hypothetical protein K6G65_10750 [Lachnospiraceae bacterium]|nr:hypothetical protein [Lachnospiraceae bacterium]
MNQNDNMTMTYSSIVAKDGKPKVCVRFERKSEHKLDFAEGILPECEMTSHLGFTKEELVQLKRYLVHHKKEILMKSKDISNIVRYFQGDGDTKQYNE